jgi:exodeoxyribonuclease VIII
LHTAVLEPDLWHSTIAVPPHAFDRRTKIGKELAAEFEREAAGKIVLSPDDADQVRRMADAVRTHPAAKLILDLPGRREPSYTWSDPATGLPCKTRPDWHSDDRRIVVDVKTSHDASRAEFSKSIANYDYHVQAAWNQAALEAEQFITIAVEKTRPFAVAVYPLSGALIAAGQRRIEAAMTLLAECEASGVWPGYGDLVQEPIELPGWCRD